MVLRAKIVGNRKRVPIDDIPLRLRWRPILAVVPHLSLAKLYNRVQPSGRADNSGVTLLFAGLVQQQELTILYLLSLEQTQGELMF